MQLQSAGREKKGNAKAAAAAVRRKRQNYRQRKANLYKFQLHLFADVSHHGGRHYAFSVFRIDFRRVSLDPIGLDGPSLGEEGCE